MSNTIYGNRFSNTFIPDSATDNFIFARGGDDFIFEGATETPQNDRYFGGKGNDTITSLSGNDLVFGGPGNDNVSIVARECLTVIGGKGYDILLVFNPADLKYVTTSGFEEIQYYEPNHPDIMI